jgi:DICT domain-containing protein
MYTVVEPHLSVYTLTKRIPEKRQFIHHRRTMSLISREIENATIIDHSKNRIFAGFQVFSKFLPQQKRYERLAAHAESVYVFGVLDVIPPPIVNITYIQLEPHAQLAKEWFLVSYGPAYMSTLATEEQSTLETPDPERIFHGAWTFEDEMVEILNDWLSSAVNAQPFHISEGQRNYAKQVEIMSRTMASMAQNLADEKNAVIKQEVKQSIDTALPENLEKVLSSESASEENSISGNAADPQ